MIDNYVNNKITLLVSSLSGGGAEGVCVSVANGLANIGWEVDLVVMHLNKTAYLDRVDKKVKLISLASSNARYAMIPLLKYIRSAKPEKVVVFKYELTALLVLMRSLFNLKLKIIARNMNMFSKSRKQRRGVWQKQIANRLIQRFFCKVDHVINQCEAMQNDLITIFPSLVNKTSVIYNPVAKHVEDYALLNDRDIVDNQQEYLLCVGRLEKQKAFHYAIEGFAKLKDSQPNLRLKFVGQGSLEQDLKALCGRLGVRDRVDFEGFQSDMLPYYTQAKATLLTSLYEGFPNVLVESITLGIPVVAFDCPSGPSEIVVQGVNGYLVEQFNANELSQSINDCLNNTFDKTAIQNTASKNKVAEVIKKYSQLIKSI